MTRDDLLQYHENICLTAKELMNLKNRDYAGNESFNDTIVDVINYMVLLSAYVKEKENVNPISDEDSQLYLFEADLSITSPNFQKEIVDIHEC